MVNVVLFTSENCPKCNRLKKFLESKNVPFTIIDISSPEGLTELRFNGCFALEAPVLQIEDNFLTTKALFKGNEISISSIQEAINK